MDVRHVELDAGLRLEYVEHGDPDGRPVVLLHGLTDSWRAWDLLLTHLPSSIRAFAVSQRGHGDSGRPDDGYAIGDFAADVGRFMDAVGIDAAVLVGHSSHGFIAQRCAVDHPDRTQGVVAIGSPATVRDKPGLHDLVSALATVRDPLDPDFVRDFQSSTWTVPIPDTFVETIVAESLKVPARVWRACFEGLLDEDVSDERQLIRAPTLLLWGDADAIVDRAEQDVLLHAILGARLVVYEGVGHAPHWEVPDRVAADLAAFVEAL